MRYLISIFALAILVSCSGSGSSNYSAVMSAVDNSTGKVFVLRDTGFSGGGALMTVTLNGMSLGKIGNGETAVGNTNSGTNYIEARFGGISGMGLNSAPASFEGSKNKNNYFLVKLTTGALKNRLQMFEVNEAAFKGSF